MSATTPDVHKRPPQFGDTRRSGGARSTVGQPQERPDTMSATARPRVPREPRIRMQPVDAMRSAAREQGIPLAEVMRRAGVCAKSHWSWQHEYAPNAAHLEAALNVLGLTLRAVPIGSNDA